MTVLDQVSTKDMTTNDWLKERKKGIGGTDISAILGLSKYRSPIQVYMDKRGELPDEDLYTVDEDGAFTGGNEAAYWGNKDEEVVAKEFQSRTKMKVRRKNAMIKHPDYPHFFANVDRLIVGKKEGLECKTTSAFLAGEWKDEIVPDQYFLQIQWYMAVTGYEAWWIAVRIGGNQFMYKRIERDEGLVQMLIKKANEFWHDHILADEPPEMDGSSASTDLLNRLYPESQPMNITLPNGHLEKLEEIDEIKAKKKELDERENELKNKIMDDMGDFEKGVFENSDRKVSWKSVERSQFNKKALKAEYPDLVEKFTEKKSSRRFTI